MGILDVFRQPQNIDSAAAVKRRTAMAEAIDGAMKPSKPHQRSRMFGQNMARMMFASADVGRLTGDWPTNPVPADWIISKFQRTLVARSREQANNNDYMKAFLRLQRINIVGPRGFTYQSQVVDAKGNADPVVRRAIERFIEKWGHRASCDIAGKLSWRGMQTAQLETVVRDGESFTQIITGKDAGPFGYTLKVIDPQRCPTGMDRNDLRDGAFIRQGIEFNRHGRPIAYYFADDLASRSAEAYSVYNGNNYVRIPADQIIHAFVQEMPGQRRGLPWMATGLFRAKQMSATEDAAVVNARIGAAKMGFIQFKDGEGPEYDDEEGLELDAEAGTFPVLPTGSEFKEFAPQYPAGEFAPFMKHLLRGQAAGGGVSYHSLSQDLTDVNFSSIRHGALDERETYKEKQEWFGDDFIERVIESLIPRALLAGHIVDEKGRPLQASKVDAYMAHKLQPRRWKYIDPRADADAAESSKNNLLTSPSQLIHEEGRDPDEVWAEIGADVKAMQAAGIPDAVIAASFGNKPAPKPVEKQP